MDLATFLSLVGLVGFLVGLVMLIMNAVKKKPKKTSVWIACLSLILFFTGVAITDATDTSASSDTLSTKTDYSSSEVISSDPSEEEISDTEVSEDITFDSEVTETTTSEEVNPADYNSGVTYDNLARTPDDHIGDKVTLSGEVAQVIEGEDASQYRVAVDQDYDKMILIEVPTDQLSSRILENDLITIYGVSQGTVDYESTMGATITIPELTVDKFEVTGQAE